MTPEFAVSAAAGSLRGSVRADVVLPHRWTDEGVAVETEFTGAHLLHLAVAACVLNDLYREARRSGLVLHGVRVSAQGDFDRRTWGSTGITYDVAIESEAPDEDVRALLATVDEVAEIPRALRQASRVERGDEPDLPARS